MSFFTVFHFYRGNFRGFDDSPRAIFREGALRGYAHADYTVTKRGDAHFGVAIAEFNSVFKFLDVLQRAHMLPALRQ